MFVDGSFGREFYFKPDSGIHQGYAAKTDVSYVFCLANSSNFGIVGDLKNIDSFPDLFSRYLYLCKQSSVDIRGVDWDFTPRNRNLGDIELNYESIDFGEQFVLSAKVRELLSEPELIAIDGSYYTDLSSF